MSPPPEPPPHSSPVDAALESTSAIGAASAIGADSATGEVRSGSPFAADPPPSRYDAEPFAEGAGVANEMARGGTLASWLMILFAGPCVWGFPFGGVLIAGLGSLLSLFGCAAPRPRWAIAALLIHASLLTFASLRWLEAAP